MRAGLGVMMVVHGLPKLTGGIDKWVKLGGAMENLNIHFAPAFWGFMAAITETIGGLFCVLGLWFRIVCLFMIFTFIVASTLHLSKGDSLAEASHAIELLFAFIGLLYLGPGKYSVDRG
jgi:putative oxidoreductase